MENKIRVEEILEIAEKQAGAEASEIVLDRHLKRLMFIRDKFPIDDAELLTPTPGSTKGPISQVREALNYLHGTMQRLIQEVANRIENEKYSSAEQAIGGLSLSLAQREKVTNLIAADKKLHISCQSLKVAVELFSELNKKIIDRLEHEHALEPGEERKLVLGNAILVYELTEFSIRFIEKFKLQGVIEIQSIHRDMQNTITALRREQQALKEQAASPAIEPFLREQVEKDIANREESITVLEEEWESYMRTTTSFQKEVGSVTKKLPSLKLIRDNAKAQINTLAAVAVLQIVQSNIKAIEGTVLQLEKLQLASLSADRVRRLLGI